MDVYMSKNIEVRAVEFLGIETALDLFRARIFEYFSEIDFFNGRLCLNGRCSSPVKQGEWIVWRNELRVDILSVAEFQKEFHSRPANDVSVHSA